jgi:integrase
MAARKPIRTELQLSNLHSEPTRYDVPIAASPGLVVRVFPSGKKSFRWTRSAGYSPRVITYGSFPDLSLADAVRGHEAAKTRQQNGEVVITHAATVNELADLFYEKRLRPHLRSADHVRRIIEVHILAHIGDRKITSLNPQTCTGLIDRLVEQGKEAHAKTVLARLKQMLDFAVARGLLEASPAISLKTSDMGIHLTPRQRALSGEEIAAFFQALDCHRRLSLQTKLAFRLLLLSGVRTGELLKAQWENVDFEGAVWTIPPSDQKLTKKREANARPFVVPLSAQALELFQEAKHLSGASVFVFGTASKTGRLDDKVLGHALRRMFESGKLEMAPFHPHDLRRTCRTHLSALRIPPHIAERCLNHSLGKILETYDTFDFVEERREAMQRWADQLDIFTGKVGNVVAFNNARAA